MIDDNKNNLALSNPLLALNISNTKIMKKYSFVDSADFSTAGAYLTDNDIPFSDGTKNILNEIEELQLQPQSSIVPFSNSETLDERLFDARANIKILLSRVSMHVAEEWRERLNRQIDLLHDSDNWEDEDYPISVQSFQTFLRWFFVSSPKNPPGFGLSSTGNFIAAWSVNNDKLILEFLPDDTVKWIVKKYNDDDDEFERATGFAKSSRIMAILAPYNSDDWFIA